MFRRKFRGKPQAPPLDTHRLRRIELRYDDSQMGLGCNGHYLLVAEEYSGDDPTVIDLATSAQLISAHARAAVWIP